MRAFMPEGKEGQAGIGNQSALHPLCRRVVPRRIIIHFLAMDVKENIFKQFRNGSDLMTKRDAQHLGIKKPSEAEGFFNVTLRGRFGSARSRKFYRRSELIAINEHPTFIAI